MVHLELTPGEAVMLREILKIYSKELGLEIAHTDSREFRKGLKEREAFLRTLLERLNPVPV